MTSYLLLSLFALFYLGMALPLPGQNDATPFSAVSTIQIDGERIKNTLPLDLTDQPSERTQYNLKRQRIPYTSYTGLSTLEAQPQTLIGPKAKDTESVSESGQGDQDHQNSDETALPGSIRKDPPIDNGGRHAKEGDFRNYEQGTGRALTKRGKASSSEFGADEAMRRAEMREYVDRGLGHVLEQRRWLLERDGE